MKQAHLILLLAGVLAVAGVLALRSVFGTGRGGAEAPPQPPPALREAWRVPLSARACRPCPAAGGWVVADAAGGVTAFTADGRVSWRAAFSNEVFAGASEVGGGRVAVAAESGRVFGLDGATGATLWTSVTDARFQHAPLAGLRGDEPVLWLVSQADGRLFCLRAADGTVVWVTEATNRCDGEPAVLRASVAYGNCDGAVYVFDAGSGALRGTVSVGADDQMAGGVLALEDGRLVTGTRAGNLAVINPETATCEAKVKVSESEAFVTPVLCFGALVAMGSDEGWVTLWRTEGPALTPAGRWQAGAAVKSLLAAGSRLYALAGGAVCEMETPDRPLRKLALGDDVGPLSARASGELACVADQALVCVKGGGR